MKTVGVIGFFFVFVLFAALIAMWRRADDWDGISLARRCVLAISASRNWWLAYSFGLLALFTLRYRYTFLETIPVVLVAFGLAGVLVVLRLPR